MATATTRPDILDGDTVRPLTDDELAQREIDAAAAEQAAAEQAAVVDSRMSAVAKLAALGLTEAEITALLGS